MESINIEEKNRYATKKKGATECEPFWNLEDVKKVIDYFKKENDWDSYLAFMLGLLLGRRIGDTLMLKWSDFFFENGREKKVVDTIEEQKTGKTAKLPVSKMTFDVIRTYCEQTKINPIEHINDYVFNLKTKTAWIERRNNEVYMENNIESWCEFLGKDFTEKRKEDILIGFEKQKTYKTLGEYLYWQVEYMDVSKWQTDEFRKKLKKAVTESGIEYRLSCHSLRKTFGYWSKMIHPGDPMALETLMDIFKHANTTVTLNYIGLSEKRKQQYFDDFGDMIRRVENGDTDVIIDNSPVISLKQDDIRSIFKYLIENKEDTDIQKFSNAMKMVDDLKLNFV